MSLRSMTASLGRQIMTRVAGPGTWLKSTTGTVGSFIPKDYPWNWWQKDMPIGSADYERFGPIQACVSIISQDLSRIPMRLVSEEDNGKRTVVKTKAPARLLRKPNKYQTRSDFMLYLVRSLLVEGNGYAIVGSRNSRNEIESLYPINPRMMWPFIEPESGEYFYRIGSDATTEIAGWDPADVWLPPRDVFHIRLHTPKHPLIGETPLVAAMYPTMAGTEINKHNASFFRNMSRPSGVLRHPGRLKPDALSRIKERFMELTQRNKTGEPVVLSEGMEWQSLQMNAVDAELAASYQLSERQIFQIFRVPPFLGGDMNEASFSNVESLTRFYLQSCLGFYVDHFEESFTDFFNLPGNEEVLFDLERALLRGDMKERMDAYGKAIQNGVMAPNEARERENLPPVHDGDEPRVQQQLVPLSYGANIQPPVPGTSTGTTGGAPAPDDDDSKDDSAKDDEEEVEKRIYLAYSAIKRVVNE